MKSFFNKVTGIKALFEGDGGKEETGWSRSPLRNPSIKKEKSSSFTTRAYDDVPLLVANAAHCLSDAVQAILNDTAALTGENVAGFKRLLSILNSEREFENPLEVQRSHGEGCLFVLLVNTDHPSFVETCARTGVATALLHALRLLRMLEIKRAKQHDVHSDSKRDAHESPSPSRSLPSPQLDPEGFPVGITCDASEKVCRIFEVLIMDSRIVEQMRQSMLKLLTFPLSVLPTQGRHLQQHSAAIISSMCKSGFSSQQVWFMHDIQVVNHMVRHLDELSQVSGPVPDNIINNNNPTVASAPASASAAARNRDGSSGSGAVGVSSGNGVGDDDTDGSRIMTREGPGRQKTGRATNNSTNTSSINSRGSSDHLLRGYAAERAGVWLNGSRCIVDVICASATITTVLLSDFESCGGVKLLVRILRYSAVERFMRCAHVVTRLHLDPSASVEASVAPPVAGRVFSDLLHSSFDLHAMEILKEKEVGFERLVAISEGVLIANSAKMNGHRDYIVQGLAYALLTIYSHDPRNCTTLEEGFHFIPTLLSMLPIVTTMETISAVLTTLNYVCQCIEPSATFPLIALCATASVMANRALDKTMTREQRDLAFQQLEMTLSAFDSIIRSNHKYAMVLLRGGFLNYLICQPLDRLIGEVHQQEKQQLQLNAVHSGRGGDQVDRGLLSIERGANDSGVKEVEPFSVRVYAKLISVLIYMNSKSLYLADKISISGVPGRVRVLMESRAVNNRFAKSLLCIPEVLSLSDTSQLESNMRMLLALLKTINGQFEKQGRLLDSLAKIFMDSDEAGQFCLKLNAFELVLDVISTLEGGFIPPTSPLSPPTSAELSPPRLLSIRKSENKVFIGKFKCLSSAMRLLSVMFSLSTPVEGEEDFDKHEMYFRAYYIRLARWLFHTGILTDLRPADTYLAREERGAVSLTAAPSLSSSLARKCLDLVAGVINCFSFDSLAVINPAACAIMVEILPLITPELATYGIEWLLRFTGYNLSNRIVLSEAGLIPQLVRKFYQDIVRVSDCTSSGSSGGAAGGICSASRDDDEENASWKNPVGQQHPSSVKSGPLASSMSMSLSMSISGDSNEELGFQNSAVHRERLMLQSLIYLIKIVATSHLTMDAFQALFAYIVRPLVLSNGLTAHRMLVPWEAYDSKQAKRSWDVLQFIEEIALQSLHLRNAVPHCDLGMNACRAYQIKIPSSAIATSVDSGDLSPSSLSADYIDSSPIAVRKGAAGGGGGGGGEYRDGVASDGRGSGRGGGRGGSDKRKAKDTERRDKNAGVSSGGEDRVDIGLEPAFVSVILSEHSGRFFPQQAYTYVAWFKLADSAASDGISLRASTYLSHEQQQQQQALRETSDHRLRNSSLGHVFSLTVDASRSNNSSNSKGLIPLLSLSAETVNGCYFEVHYDLENAFVRVAAVKNGIVSTMPLLFRPVNPLVTCDWNLFALSFKKPKRFTSASKATVAVFVNGIQAAPISFDTLEMDLPGANQAVELLVGKSSLKFKSSELGSASLGSASFSPRAMTSFSSASSASSASSSSILGGSAVMGPIGGGGGVLVHNIVDLWKLGPFFLYDEVLDADQIALIFTKGPQYEGSYQADSPLMDHLPSLSADLLDRYNGGGGGDRGAGMGGELGGGGPYGLSATDQLSLLRLGDLSMVVDPLVETTSFLPATITVEFPVLPAPVIAFSAKRCVKMALGPGGGGGDGVVGNGGRANQHALQMYLRNSHILSGSGSSGSRSSGVAGVSGPMSGVLQGGGSNDFDCDSDSDIGESQDEEGARELEMYGNGSFMCGVVSNSEDGGSVVVGEDSGSREDADSPVSRARRSPKKRIKRVVSKFFGVEWRCSMLNSASGFSVDSGVPVASLENGSLLGNPMSFSDCVASMGGPEFLFPMLQAASNPAQICLALSFIRASLRLNSSNLRYMQCGGGYKIMAFILSLKPRHAMQPAVLQSLFEIATSAWRNSAGFTSSADGVLLIDTGAYYHLLMNHQLWNPSRFDIARHALSVMSLLIRDERYGSLNIKRLSLLGATRWVLLLCVYGIESYNTLLLEGKKPARDMTEWEIQCASSVELADFRDKPEPTIHKAMDTIRRLMCVELRRKDLEMIVRMILHTFIVPAPIPPEYSTGADMARGTSNSRENNNNGGGIGMNLSAASSHSDDPHVFIGSNINTTTGTATAGIASGASGDFNQIGGDSGGDGSSRSRSSSNSNTSVAQLLTLPYCTIEQSVVQPDSRSLYFYHYYYFDPINNSLGPSAVFRTYLLRLLFYLVEMHCHQINKNNSAAHPSGVVGGGIAGVMGGYSYSTLDSTFGGGGGGGSSIIGAHKRHSGGDNHTTISHHARRGSSGSTGAVAAAAAAAASAGGGQSGAGSSSMSMSSGTATTILGDANGITSAAAAANIAEIDPEDIDNNGNSSGSSSSNIGSSSSSLGIGGMGGSGAGGTPRYQQQNTVISPHRPIADLADLFTMFRGSFTATWFLGVLEKSTSDIASKSSCLRLLGLLMQKDQRFSKDFCEADGFKVLCINLANTAQPLPVVLPLIAMLFRVPMPLMMHPSQIKNLAKFLQVFELDECLGPDVSEPAVSEISLPLLSLLFDCLTNSYRAHGNVASSSMISVIEILMGVFNFAIQSVQSFKVLMQHKAASEILAFAALSCSNAYNEFGTVIYQPTEHSGTAAAATAGDICGRSASPSALLEPGGIPIGSGAGGGGGVMMLDLASSLQEDYIRLSSDVDPTRTYDEDPHALAQVLMGSAAANSSGGGISSGGGGGGAGSIDSGGGEGSVSGGMSALKGSSTGGNGGSGLRGGGGIQAHSSGGGGSSRVLGGIGLGSVGVGFGVTSGFRSPDGGNMRMVPNREYYTGVRSEVTLLGAEGRKFAELIRVTLTQSITEFINSNVLFNYLISYPNSFLIAYEFGFQKLVLQQFRMVIEELTSEPSMGEATALVQSITDILTCVLPLARADILYDAIQYECMLIAAELFARVTKSANVSRKGLYDLGNTARFFAVASVNSWTISMQHLNDIRTPVKNYNNTVAAVFEDNAENLNLLTKRGENTDDSAVSGSKFTPVQINVKPRGNSPKRGIAGGELSGGRSCSSVSNSINSNSGSSGRRKTENLRLSLLRSVGAHIACLLYPLLDDASECAPPPNLRLMTGGGAGSSSSSNNSSSANSSSSSSSSTTIGVGVGVGGNENSDSSPSIVVPGTGDSSFATSNNTNNNNSSSNINSNKSSSSSSGSTSSTVLGVFQAGFPFSSSSSATGISSSSNNINSSNNSNSSGRNSGTMGSAVSTGVGGIGGVAPTALDLGASSCTISLNFARGERNRVAQVFVMYMINTCYGLVLDDDSAVRIEATRIIAALAQHRHSFLEQLLGNAPIEGKTPAKKSFMETAFSTVSSARSAQNFLEDFNRRNSGEFDIFRDAIMRLVPNAAGKYDLFLRGGTDDNESEENRFADFSFCISDNSRKCDQVFYEIESILQTILPSVQEVEDIFKISQPMRIKDVMQGTTTSDAAGVVLAMERAEYGQKMGEQLTTLLRRWCNYPTMYLSSGAAAWRRVWSALQAGPMWGFLSLPDNFCEGDGRMVPNRGFDAMNWFDLDYIAGLPIHRGVKKWVLDPLEGPERARRKLEQDLSTAATEVLMSREAYMQSPKKRKGKKGKKGVGEDSPAPTNTSAPTTATEGCEGDEHGLESPAVPSFSPIQGGGLDPATCTSPVAFNVSSTVAPSRPIEQVGKSDSVSCGVGHGGTPIRTTLSENDPCEQQRIRQNKGEEGVTKKGGSSNSPGDNINKNVASVGTEKIWPAREFNIEADEEDADADADGDAEEEEEGDRDGEGEEGEMASFLRRVSMRGVIKRLDSITNVAGEELSERETAAFLASIDEKDEREEGDREEDRVDGVDKGSGRSIESAGNTGQMSAGTDIEKDRTRDETGKRKETENEVAKVNKQEGGEAAGEEDRRRREKAANGVQRLMRENPQYAKEAVVVGAISAELEGHRHGQHRQHQDQQGARGEAGAEAEAEDEDELRHKNNVSRGNAVAGEKSPSGGLLSDGGGGEDGEDVLRDLDREGERGERESGDSTGDGGFSSKRLSLGKMLSLSAPTPTSASSPASTTAAAAADGGEDDERDSTVVSSPFAGVVIGWSGVSEVPSSGPESTPSSIASNTSAKSLILRNFGPPSSSFSSSVKSNPSTRQLPPLPSSASSTGTAEQDATAIDRDRMLGTTTSNYNNSTNNSSTAAEREHHAQHHTNSDISAGRARRSSFEDVVTRSERHQAVLRSNILQEVVKGLIGLQDWSLGRAYNIKRIFGLEAQPALLILSSQNIHVLSGFKIVGDAGAGYDPPRPNSSSSSSSRYERAKAYEKGGGKGGAGNVKSRRLQECQLDWEHSFTYATDDKEIDCTNDSNNRHQSSTAATTGGGSSKNNTSRRNSRNSGGGGTNTCQRDNSFANPYAGFGPAGRPYMSSKLLQQLEESFFRESEYYHTDWIKNIWQDILSSDLVFSCIPLDQVYSFFKRRHELKYTALEITDVKGYTLLFACAAVQALEDILLKLLEADLPNSVFNAVVGMKNIQLLRGAANLYNRLVSLFISTITHSWQHNELTNFEYLMHINAAAGRSFLDLTQYPVFPWVLADYTSEDIDLTDERVYRDLSKPMGALGAKRAQQYRDRYQTMDEFYREGVEGCPPPFYYGTHYSCTGYVLHYLIRLQPYSKMAVALQGGSFDKADRLFLSIESSWRSASQDNLQDVRELIPEFFYLPEFLSNHNKLDFGTTQRGECVDNVKLPRWAKGDPKEFIRIHRCALESKYVSENLHSWIDLIFGCKQRGNGAVDALNVFIHLTYEGEVDIDAIDDPVLQLATIAQINNFGQTPSKIFSRPHVKKIVPTIAKRIGGSSSSLGGGSGGSHTPVSGVNTPSLSGNSDGNGVVGEEKELYGNESRTAPFPSAISSSQPLSLALPISPPALSPSPPPLFLSSASVSFTPTSSTPATTTSATTVVTHSHIQQSTAGMSFVVDPSALSWHSHIAPPLSVVGATEYSLLTKVSHSQVAFPGNVKGLSVNDVYVPVRSDRIVVCPSGCVLLPPLYKTCVRFGGASAAASLTVTSLPAMAGSRSLDQDRDASVHENLHQKAITCVAVSRNGDLIATGSEDSSVRLWSFTRSSGGSSSSSNSSQQHSRRLHHVCTFAGHRGAVKCLDIASGEYSLLVSGGNNLDRSVCVWDTRTQRLIRILGDHKGPVLSVSIGALSGVIVTLTALQLRIYHINGDLLGYQNFVFHLNGGIREESGDFARTTLTPGGGAAEGMEGIVGRSIMERTALTGRGDSSIVSPTAASGAAAAAASAVEKSFPTFLGSGSSSAFSRLGGSAKGGGVAGGGDAYSSSSENKMDTSREFAMSAPTTVLATPSADWQNGVVAVTGHVGGYVYLWRLGTVLRKSVPEQERKRETERAGDGDGDEGSTPTVQRSTSTDSDSGGGRQGKSGKRRLPADLEAQPSLDSTVADSTSPSPYFPFQPPSASLSSASSSFYRTATAANPSGGGGGVGVAASAAEVGGVSYRDHQLLQAQQRQQNRVLQQHHAFRRSKNLVNIAEKTYELYICGAPTKLHKADITALRLCSSGAYTSSSGGGLGSSRAKDIVARSFNDSRSLELLVGDAEGFVSRWAPSKLDQLPASDLQGILSEHYYKGHQRHLCGAPSAEK